MPQTGPGTFLMGAVLYRQHKGFANNGKGAVPRSSQSMRGGLTPVFTDTYEKADPGHEECSC